MKKENKNQVSINRRKFFFYSLAAGGAVASFIKSPFSLFRRKISRLADGQAKELSLKAKPNPNAVKREVKA